MDEVDNLTQSCTLNTHLYDIFTVIKTLFGTKHQFQGILRENIKNKSENGYIFVDNALGNFPHSFTLNTRLYDIFVVIKYSF